MKKAIGLVVGGLVMLCGVAPYGFGVRTEQTLTALVQLAEYVLDVPISTSRYTRGWFSSTAVTWLTLPPELAEVLRAYVPFVLTPAARAEGLTVMHRILHGPFPVALRAGGAMSLLPVQTILTSELVPGVPGVPRDGRQTAARPILQVYTTVFLHGAGQGHVFMPAFTYTPPAAQPETNIVWDGLQGDVVVGVQGKHVTGTFQTPGLQLVGAERTFTLHDARMRTDVSTERRHRSRSDTSVRIGSMALTPHTETQATWAVTGAELRTTTTTASGTLQAVADVRLETLRLADAAYGSGTSHLELHRLHLPALVRLLQALRVLQQAEPDLASRWLRWQGSDGLARLLSECARSSPELSLTGVSLHTTAGEIRARVQVRVDGDRLLVPGYLTELLQAIEVDAEGEAPVAWVRATAITQVRRALRRRSRFAALFPDPALDVLAATITDQQLRDLVAQEYLVLDGDMYKSKVRYTRGQLLVHGKPVDVPVLAP
ncbi:MAG TPA: DUF945 family protein [Candidatus Tectomicrobia bacterium]